MLPLTFQPLRTTLYSAKELFAGFDPAKPSTYCETADFRIYRQYVAAGRYAPTDYFTAMMEAVHDNAIREATQDYLKSLAARKAVAFMGGHDLPRTSMVYAQVAFLARKLARSGFLPVSGGGPGAMEATHLGALHRHASEAQLRGALRELAQVPSLPDGIAHILSADGKEIDRRLAKKAHAWLAPAYRVRARIRRPGESLAVPTWLYGHEPTTALATAVAKYFQNSVREDRLLALATHGVIYVEGKAGTLQEVFQDATQNYYRVQGQFSPMIFLGRRLWQETLPVIPVLQRLFSPQDFAAYVRVTDDPAEILRFLKGQGQRPTPAERMQTWLRAEKLPAANRGEARSRDSRAAPAGPESPPPAARSG